MDPFLTTYRKDYVTKKIPPTKRSTGEQEYADPISEGFRNYLKLKKGKYHLKPKEEYVDNYLQKFKELYPKLGQIYFQTPLESTVVERDFTMDGQTVYQVDYCDSEKDRVYLEELKKKETVILPSDWITPETTSLSSYRDPRLMKEDALNVVKPIRPPNGEWGASKEVADILQVITGKSEYQGVIGALGNIIINDHIHEKDRGYLEELKKKKIVILPSNWIIPESTSLSSYRDPRLMNEDALNVVKPFRPPNGDWGASKEVADILQVITGKSEYQAVIGALGDVIMNDQIHGKIILPTSTCGRHNFY